MAATGTIEPTEKTETACATNADGLLTDSLEWTKEQLMPNDGIPTHPSQSPSRKRKSTGKRLRFEIFKRDNFTCQYCGAQPPDVVLVVDHIHPVSAGGTNDELNLITACETCNQGKADKPLGDRIVRPDADLLYLETQQEIAELERYRESLAIREAEILKVVESLQNLWITYSALDWHPADHTILGMIQRHSPEVVEAAIRDVAPKVGTGYISDYGDKWLKYLYAVARNISEDWGES